MIGRLDPPQYAPGVWRCPKCKFRLVQANLNAVDGTVTARDTPGDTCPNCAGPLWRVSWKEEAEENLDIGIQQFERAKVAEDLVRRAILLVEADRNVLVECHSVSGELRLDPDDEGDQAAKRSIEAADAWLAAARKAVQP